MFVENHEIYELKPYTKKLQNLKIKFNKSI